MGRAAFALFTLLLLLAPDASAAATRRAARTPSGRTQSARTAHAKPRAIRAPRLAEAKAAMSALMRDKHRRRYRHNWERAITNLTRAARGKDRPAGLLEAARSRYALYRWSADEADRDEALRLANLAAKLGAREARALATAIRREAGDDRPAPPPRAPTRRAPAPPAPEPPEEDAPDPALEEALGELAKADAPMALGESRGEGPATVTEVRAWSSPEYTRVAVYLSHWVGWQKLDLAPDGNLPRRLALDLRPARLEGRALVRPVPGEQVARVRAAQNDKETVRVVLDLAGRDQVQIFRLDDPPRFVLDVGTPVHHDPPAVAAAEPPQAPPGAGGAPPEEAAAVEPTPEVAGSPAAPAPRAEPDTAVTLPPRVLAALERVEALRPPSPPAPGPIEVFPSPVEGARAIRRVVVDAGHGGHDPGAIGPSRVREKTVTLAIARRLSKRLRAAGFEVVLTRNRDRYLALEERTAIANTARGDLFVSIHANAHPRRNRTGIETYFLNVTDDRYAARLAARENGLDLSNGDEVARILTDLNAKASAGTSQKLARLVQHEVCGGVRTRVGDVRDLGVKSALFYVLLGARMPAVLVETGFISNRAEERRLASPRYQDEVAAGIARAVIAFARAETQVASR
jgi:N-acetylmuramoyl-L-alanine amidase